MIKKTNFCFVDCQRYLPTICCAISLAIGGPKIKINNTKNKQKNHTQKE